METRLADFIKDTARGIEADRILRACVHCGFCTATCPTYNILGDELDGPRGRIYQIKQVLEGTPASATTQQHLDRCLTCRSCETTCPSGVQYGRLLDIGRAVVDEQVQRPAGQRLIRWGLRRLLTHPGLFALSFRLGRLARPILPEIIKKKLPPVQVAAKLPAAGLDRKVILAGGCVQPTYKPATNVALARVLHRLGIEAVLVPDERCCGAVSYHLDAHREALNLMRANIDAWWPLVEAGAEAIVSSASGCGVLIKDYGHVLKDDPVYAEKAEKISSMTRDACEILEEEDLSKLQIGKKQRVAFQSPCTLQHGQQLSGRVESLLSALGFKLTEVGEPHFCCGSAGTYSVLQPELSSTLQKRKVDNLEKGRPDVIATANIGCQLHIESATRIPVKHWIELLDDPTMPL